MTYTSVLEGTVTISDTVAERRQINRFGHSERRDMGRRINETIRSWGSGYRPSVGNDALALERDAMYAIGCSSLDLRSIELAEIRGMVLAAIAHAQARHSAR